MRFTRLQRAGLAPAATLFATLALVLPARDAHAQVQSATRVGPGNGDGMANLTASLPCPEGFLCGASTSKQTQRDHPVPGGHYAHEGTPPGGQYDNACPPGAYCVTGTRASLARGPKAMWPELRSSLAGTCPR